MRKLILGAILGLLVFTGSAAAEEAEQQVKEAQPSGFDPRLAFGIGVGVPFGGGVGGNVEVELNRYFSASVGLGISSGELGWAGGLQAYPIGHDHTVSPRLSAYYGTVAVLDWGTHTELDTGAAYGAGLSWRNQPNGSFEFDLLYIDYDPPRGFVKEDGGDINLMLGYRWRY